MEQKTKSQLLIIDSLLKSADFSLAIAQSQNAAYYNGIGKPVPAFSTAAEDSTVIFKSTKLEKVATSLAGFYALECGIDFLCDQTKEKPTAWLQKIIDDKTDTATILLLNRFANASWKAGQPFRGLSRITRPVFTGAGFLPEAEIKKDYRQVKTAAVKLLASLQHLKNSSTHEQFRKIRSLLHSQVYALEMASFIDAGYTAGEKEPATVPLSSQEENATIRTTVREQKIATSIAGFYAVECGANYLVSIRNTLPSDVLRSIVNNSISKEDKNLFCRFANITWKAGQPFRGLDRIERETFTPFYFLQEADIHKDWVQVQAAAKKVLAEL